MSDNKDILPSSTQGDMGEWATLTSEAEKTPVKVDLKTPEWTEKFAGAELYVKNAPIKAEQLTQESIEAFAASGEKDIRFDEESGEYVVDSYVMRERTAEDGSTERYAEIESTRAVHPGDWLATNPRKKEGDHDNNYPISEETFQKTFMPGEESGTYLKKTPVRILKNETGGPVVVDSPWGGEMNGDEECYFCVACSDTTVEGIHPTKRYILSKNDFEKYVPLEDGESEA